MARIDLVIFDCDSTLSTIEGVDELAVRSGQRERIAALTGQAMDGGIKLEEVYGQRLDLIRPDRTALEWLGRRYVETLTPGARETVSALAAAGYEIHVVSGGLRPAVVVLAADLGIPAENVHAVDVFYDAQNNYAGYDQLAPAARSGGKATIIAEIASGGRRAVMIGDGVTDLEAASVGAVVIGFGGVVAREVVRQGADYFVEGPSLWPCVDLINALDKT